MNFDLPVMLENMESCSYIFLWFFKSFSKLIFGGPFFCESLFMVILGFEIMVILWLIMVVTNSYHTWLGSTWEHTSPWIFLCAFQHIFSKLDCNLNLPCLLWIQIHIHLRVVKERNHYSWTMTHFLSIHHSFFPTCDF